MTPAAEPDAIRARAVSIRLDGQVHVLPRGTTLAELVQGLGHAPDAVTTAVNARFVPRAQREGCVLDDGDAVVLFQPIVGG